MLTLPAGFDYETFVGDMITFGIALVGIGTVFLILALCIKIGHKAKQAL